MFEITPRRYANYWVVYLIYSMIYKYINEDTFFFCLELSMTVGYNGYIYAEGFEKCDLLSDC